MTLDYSQYIVEDPKICGGEPVIRTTRVTVRTVLASLGEGATMREILDDFPSLTEEAVGAVIALAAASAAEVAAGALSFDLLAASVPALGLDDLRRLRTLVDQGIAQLEEGANASAWEVREPVAEYDGDREGLVIDVGQQGDGCTFRLHPRSRRRLATGFPEAQPLDSLFVSYDAGQQPEHALGSRWSRIAFLLTGLDESQIKQLGGFQVAEAASGRVLFSSRNQTTGVAKV